MSRPTKQILAVLIVAVLACVGTVAALLRSGGEGDVHFADAGLTSVGPAIAPSSAGPAPSSGSASPSTAPAAKTRPAEPGVATRAAKAATAASARSARSAAGSVPSSSSRALSSSGAAGPTVKRVSVKKGASVWKQNGITASLADSGVSWMYDWAASPNGVTAPSGVEFVPMIWGAAATDATTLRTAKKNGSTLLGFNEPDLAEQSNLSVERALDLWPKLQSTGMRLGSPAVAWGADQDGQWLDRFMTGTKKRGYRVDFVTLHWYGSDFDPARATAQLKAYIQATYARYHKPIWVTEYSLMNFGSGAKLPSAAVQAEFVKKSTAMLKSLSSVERYCWFAFPTSTDGSDGTGLYRPGGARTKPGTAYRAAG